jgi:hypothetical protein
MAFLSLQHAIEAGRPFRFFLRRLAREQLFLGEKNRRPHTGRPSREAAADYTRDYGNPGISGAIMPL